jgi:hypothetical protein
MMEIEAMLGDAGAEAIACCRSIGEALAAVAAGDLDAAVLDFRLRDQTASPVAAALELRGIPFLFYTGQGENSPELAEWRHHPIVGKPERPRLLIAAIAGLLGASSPDAIGALF